MMLVRLIPYATGIVIIIAIASWIYGLGYDNAKNKYEIEKFDAIKRAIYQAEEQRKIDLDIAEKSQKTEIKTKTVYREIYKDANNVQSTCNDIGNDFISVYRNAIKAASAPTSSQ